jgi:hypothetical protein
MILALFLIAIAVVMAIALVAASVHAEDPWIDSELEAMEAVDRLLEASERARAEMRHVTGRPERSGWSPFSGETQ